MWTGVGMTHVTLVDSRGGRCRLRAAGEFDRDNCDEFPAAVRVALAGYCREIVLDLAEVTFVDAGVVSSLLACRRSAAQHGCRLRVVNEVGVVARVLELTGARAELEGIPELSPPPAGRR
jgi:anti-anti-sigma factor